MLLYFSFDIETILLIFQVSAKYFYLTEIFESLADRAARIKRYSTIEKQELYPQSGRNWFEFLLLH